MVYMSSRSSRAVDSGDKQRAVRDGPYMWVMSPLGPSRCGGRGTPSCSQINVNEPVEDGKSGPRGREWWERGGDQG